MFQDSNVPQFHPNNVPHSPDSNVPVFQDRLQGRNVPQFPDSSVPQSPGNNVPQFLDNNVLMFHPNNVSMFQLNNVPQFHANNVNRSLWNNVLLHRQLMDNCQYYIILIHSEQHYQIETQEHYLNSIYLFIYYICNKMLNIKRQMVNWGFFTQATCNFRFVVTPATQDIIRSYIDI